MRIKQAAKLFAFRRGIIFRKASSTQDIGKFVERFRQHYVSVDLIRVGGIGDGGYLVPDRALTRMYYCFSPGVSDTANFEDELATTYGIKSFLADASVATAPIANDNFHFTRRFLGSEVSDNFMLLGDWIKTSVDDSAVGLLLQMDIEGAEYDVLINEADNTLERFSILVIEFHYLRDLFDKRCLEMISSVFEKLYRNFSICHVHPNNCCGINQLAGIEIPDVIEVTFLRNDLAAELSNGDPISLPHELDCENISGKPDIRMPEAWWKAIPDQRSARL